MGKRSDFERLPRDFYPTPYSAVLPLLPFLSPNTTFIEPCAGDGRLIGHLELHGHKCVAAYDIEPQAPGIEKRDILFFGSFTPEPCDCIITNPPWDRESLHKIIELFRYRATTWLLYDSDWMFTKQAALFKRYCSKVVPIGRVSWMENGTSGMDNCCWYQFIDAECETILY